jgi:hypothetical protein
MTQKSRSICVGSRAASILLVWQAGFESWARSSGWIERQNPFQAGFEPNPLRDTGQSCRTGSQVTRFGAQVRGSNPRGPATKFQLEVGSNSSGEPTQFQIRSRSAISGIPARIQAREPLCRADGVQLLRATGTRSGYPPESSTCYSSSRGSLMS